MIKPLPILAHGLGSSHIHIETHGQRLTDRHYSQLERLRDEHELRARMAPRTETVCAPQFGASPPKGRG